MSPFGHRHDGDGAALGIGGALNESAGIRVAGGDDAVEGRADHPVTALGGVGGLVGVRHGGGGLPLFQFLRRHHARRRQRGEPLGVHALVLGIGDGRHVLRVELGRGDGGEQLVRFDPIALVDFEVAEIAGHLGVEGDLREGAGLPLQDQAPHAG